MKKLLLTSFVLLSSILFSQNNFFVDDVEYINYVTINFCVDSSGKTENIKINKEFTDYKNEEIISLIISEVQELNVNETSKLNKCFEEIYTFINEELQFSKVKENQYKNLERFKKGDFIYWSPKYRNTSIERYSNKQIENAKESKSEYQINWVKPNFYNLKILKVRDSTFNYLIGETIDVEIIKVIDINSYVYKSTLNGQEIYGIIEKIK